MRVRSSSCAVIRASAQLFERLCGQLAVRDVNARADITAEGTIEDSNLGTP